MEYLIPHYGSLKLIQKAVRSIYQCDHKARILIGDDSRLLNKEDFKSKVEIFRGPQRGFAANVNKLIKQTQGEWIVIMNNDVELARDWQVVIDNALEHVSEHTYCYASCLYQPDGQVDSFGDQYSWYGQGYNRFHLHQPKNNMYRKTRVLGATGALMVVRRSVLVQYGGFSEVLGSYCEDTAFHLQANNGGWQSYFIPGARATHYGSATFGMERKLALSARNSILVARSCFKGKLRQAMLKRSYFYWKSKALLSRRHRQIILEGIKEGLSTPVFNVSGPIGRWPQGLYIDGFINSTWRLTKQLIGDRILKRLRRHFTWSDIEEGAI